MLVTKRDGRQVVFDPHKIEVAITKAYWEEEYFPTHPIHLLLLLFLKLIVKIQYVNQFRYFHQGQNP